MNLKTLLEAEMLYLRENGWEYVCPPGPVPDTREGRTIFDLWKHPRTKATFIQPAAVMEQKRSDGYLPERHHQPISTL